MGSKKMLLLNKKASSYLLSRNESSIIGVRELDFRVRNGNGYYLSTMATGIINNASYEECWSDFSEHTGRIKDCFASLAMTSGERKR